MSHLFNLSRFFKRVSIIQKFIVVAILFWIALIPLIFFVIYTYLGLSSVLEKEIHGNAYQEKIRRLFELIPHYQVNTQTFNKESVDQAFDVNKIQEEITSLFDELVRLYQSHQNTLFQGDATPFSAPYHISPQRLQNNWLILSQQIAKSSLETNNQAYHQLLEDLVNFSHSVGDSYYLSNDSELYSFYLINATLFDLPKAQALLFHASQQAQTMIQKQSIDNIDRDKLLILIHLLDMRIEKVKEEIQKVFFYEKANHTLLSNNPLLYFTNYQTLIKQVIDTLNKNIIHTSHPTISQEEIVLLSNQALASGFKLWELTHQTLEKILIERKELFRDRFWLSFILSLTMTLLAFSLGFSLTLKSVNRLKDLTKATESFTGGNLAVRVPITYHDEIGRLGVAFNRMAQRLRDMINQLYQLLEGTKGLAKGDLRVRIHTSNLQSEFGQVAQSFNNMAQIFEDLIERFKKLGVNLTMSAAEIAMASKEQENIIIEQGATTHEIAISATKISTTAKEFANTINEITIVADKTSHLASTGKASLLNMEQIMRQMVDASTNIATKLAILNEKASNITNVIITITKVADQTNLLSLNASIEAEKAGEYGRSFAVIAREIRRLADQTAVATLDIEETVNEIVTAISSSVMGVDDFTQEVRNSGEQVKKVSEQLTTIIEQVQAFTARFESVNKGMQAQSSGAEQITAAINQLSQTTQQTSEAIYQFHLTIEELNQAANELNQLIPHFKTSKKN